MSAVNWANFLEALSLKTSTPIQSIVWLILEKVIFLGLSLVVMLAIARHLMPGSFGRLNFMLALVSLAAPVMAMGLNSLITREVLERPAAKQVIIGSALLLRIGAGLTVAAAGSAVIYFVVPSDDWRLLVLLLFSSACQAGQVVDYWLQAHVANHYAVGVRLLVLILMSGLRLAAVALDAEFATFVVLVALEFFLAGGCYLLIYHHFGEGLGALKFSLRESRSLLLQSRWLVLSGIAAIIYLKIDQIMLGIMIDDSAVGVYTAASRLSEVWYFVPAALVTSYFPQLIHKRVSDTVSYTLDVQKLNDFLFVLAVLVAIPVSMNARLFITLLYGDAYIEAAPVLVVHIWAAVLVFMRTLLSKWLITEKLLHLSLASQAAGALSNVLLNIYLIPLYGPMGAAYATVASYALAGYGVLFMHPQLRPMARVVSYSLFLPFRVLRWGLALYSPNQPR